MDVFEEVFDCFNRCSDLKVYITIILQERIEAIPNHIAVIEYWTITFSILTKTTFCPFVEWRVIFIYCCVRIECN